MPETDGGRVGAVRARCLAGGRARRSTADTVRGAMATLPDAQREAIELAYFEGLTQVEIAERTGAPLGTVKSRVRLGLQQMRRVLEGER